MTSAPSTHDPAQSADETSPSIATEYGVIEALADEAAVLDATGRLVATNQAWRTGVPCGLELGPKPSPGFDLLAALDAMPCGPSDAGPERAGEDSDRRALEAEHARQIAEGIRAVRDGRRPTFRHRVQLPGGEEWQQVTVRRFSDAAGEARLLLTRQDVTAEQRADQALLDTERRYEAVVQSQTEMICRFLPDLKLTFVNEAYCRYFNRSEAELLGRSFLELMPDEAHEDLRRELASLSPEEPIRTVTHPVTLPDGSTGWHTWTDRALFDAEGRVVELQAVGRDVTERLRALEEIRVSHERYRAVSDAGLDSFYLLEAVRDEGGVIVDFTFLDLNERAADMISRPRESVLGQRMLELLPVNRDPRFFDRYVEVVETREPLFRDFPIDAADEGIHASWMQQQVVPVGDGIAISVRDISERKQIEHDLEEQRNQNQIILDSIPALVFYKDAHNRILRVNQAAAATQGVSVAEMEGRHTRELFPEFADAFYEDDQAVMASGQPKLGYLEKIDRPDGEGARWVRTDKVPIFDDAGRAEGVLAIATDVSELMETSEKLRESERRFRELFDRMPVAVIEQDLSQVGAWLEALRSRGVTDLPTYLREHPEAIHEASQLTHTRRINQTAAELFDVSEAAELHDALRAQNVRPDTEPLILKLNVIWQRQHSGEMETRFRGTDGRLIDVFLRLVVPGDGEHLDLSRVLLAMTDISANRQRIFAQAQVEQAKRERTVLGHELHDTLGQQLTGINMLAESVRRRLAGKAPDEAERVGELARLVGQANAEVRRVISGMTPEQIAPDQLESALQSLAEGFALVHQIPVDFEAGRRPRGLDTDTANHLLLIAQEAAHNAAKHARASRILIKLDQRSKFLELTIADNGVGLPDAQPTISDPPPNSPKLGHGRGLSILHYRAEAIGATLSLTPAPGGGTLIRCRLAKSRSQNPPAPTAEPKNTP